jgi:hypothetical protein
MAFRDYDAFVHALATELQQPRRGFAELLLYHQTHNQNGCALARLIELHPTDDPTKKTAEVWIDKIMGIVHSHQKCLALLPDSLKNHELCLHLVTTSKCDADVMRALPEHLNHDVDFGVALNCWSLNQSHPLPTADPGICWSDLRSIFAELFGKHLYYKAVTKEITPEMVDEERRDLHRQLNLLPETAFGDHARRETQIRSLLMLTDPDDISVALSTIHAVGKGTYNLFWQQPNHPNRALSNRYGSYYGPTVSPWDAKQVQPYNVRDSVVVDANITSLLRNLPICNPSTVRSTICDLTKVQSLDLESSADNMIFICQFNGEFGFVIYRRHAFQLQCYAPSREISSMFSTGAVLPELHFVPCDTSKMCNVKKEMAVPALTEFLQHVLSSPNEFSPSSDYKFNEKTMHLCPTFK